MKCAWFEVPDDTTDQQIRDAVYKLPEDEFAVSGYEVTDEEGNEVHDW